MDRIIKFRAWDKWHKRMIAPHDGDFIGWHAPSNWKDCYEVMQFTGLKDCHGVDVYEGDILSFAPYMKGTKPFVIRWETMTDYSDYSPKDKAEIIGNIWQNPELLQ